MGRPKGEPTKVERLPLAEARKLRFIARKLGLSFKEAFRYVSAIRINDLHRRLKAGEHIELGENGGA